MHNVAIELKDLEFGWQPELPVLRIPHLHVERGERVLLTGPSGSGKSTLLGLIGGVLHPGKGTVHVIGTEVSALRASKADRFRGDHIGYIFQSFNLLPYLSITDNVTLSLRFSLLRRERLGEIPSEEEALRLLAALGIGGRELLARSVHRLSIGQQQRVASARALLGSPELLIADEPTSALDEDARMDFLELLNQECTRLGTTLIVVSHDRTLRAAFDRVIELPRINATLPAAA
jgi:putative ABC transport system ATP-binding protein